MSLDTLSEEVRDTR